MPIPPYYLQFPTPSPTYNNGIDERKYAILSYKVVSSYSLKLKISITTELIEFYHLGNLNIGPVMVKGYFSAHLF